MFKIDQSISYSWPIKVELPADGGKVEVHTFDGHFKRLSQERIVEINKAAESGDMNELDLSKEVLVGWKGIFEGDKEVPFSEEAKEKLLNIAMVPKAIVIAFYESLAGAKRKN